MGQLSTTIGITGVASVVYSYGDNLEYERFGVVSQVLFHLMSLSVLVYGVCLGVLSTSQCRTLLRYSYNNGLPEEYVASARLWPIMGYIYICFLCLSFTLLASFKTFLHMHKRMKIRSRLIQPHEGIASEMAL